MPENKNFTDLPIDYHNEVNDNPALYDEAERRIRKLAQGHQDIVGAEVKFRQSSQGRDHDIQAIVTLFSRPTYVTAQEISRTPEGALKGALDDVERQMREMREKLRGY